MESPTSARVQVMKGARGQAGLRGEGEGTGNGNERNNNCKLREKEVSDAGESSKQKRKLKRTRSKNKGKAVKFGGGRHFPHLKKNQEARDKTLKIHMSFWFAESNFSAFVKGLSCYC